MCEGFELDEWDLLFFGCYGFVLIDYVVFVLICCGVVVYGLCVVGDG